MKNNLQELFISIILVILLILLLNPWGMSMPGSLQMMILLGLILIFAIFASFLWRERARDERENLHRLIAGRVAFLTGSGILVLGIVIQGLRHNNDPWLTLALIGMVLAKILGLIYGRMKY